MAPAPNAGPLSDLKILDLSRILAGPYCALMFADLGADVVKVEPPKGDDTRRFGPPFVGGGESTYFLSINRGKRSIALDLKQPAAQAIVHDLARWADVVVQNFRPGDADKLAVGYGTLHEINPRLVYVSISGYGVAGDEAYTKLPGYDLVIQGVSGIASLTGPEEGPPYKLGTSVADLVAGMNAFGAALAALRERNRTNIGQHVDVSMLDGQLSLLTYQASGYLNAGKAPGRLGNAHPSICPYETLPTADGYINIACGNDKQFAALCRALGAPTLAGMDVFATNAARVEHREALLEQIIPILQSANTQTWSTRIQSAGVPCGPILNVPDALAHPQVAAREMLVSQEHATVGTTHSIATATASALHHPVREQRPPPRLGEHSLEILRDVLGMQGDAIDSAARQGAVIAAQPTERPQGSAVRSEGNRAPA